MTREEAIKYFENELSIIIHAQEIAYYENKEDYDAVNMAIEALKQSEHANSVQHHAGLMHLTECSNSGWYCENCHNKHVKKPKFCSNCGCKLDLYIKAL